MDIYLSCNKAMLLQFLSLLCVGTDMECVRCAVALSRALGKMVDLSQTRLEQQACRSLALFWNILKGCQNWTLATVSSLTTACSCCSHTSTKLTSW
ncbi:hypothetical protein P4O66_018174, partial [Electrophorus voltai]